MRSPYLNNGNPYTGKTCLYWDSPLMSFVYSFYTPHWGRETHICVSKLNIIGSDNGLSLGWHKGIFWTNAGILWIGPLGTNFSEILIEIRTFSFKKMRLKMSSGKWRPFCLGLNVLIYRYGYLQWRHNEHVGVANSPASRLFTWPFIQAQIKENIKAPRHCPLCGEFTGDRWIPCTKGQ